MIKNTLSRLCGRILSSQRRLPLKGWNSQDCQNVKFSFSQFGEDILILEYLLNSRFPQKGIYIDAGCYDPFRFSNTRLLNLHGWTGINIDASPQVVDSFNRFRPNDVNICAALSNTMEKAWFGGAHSQAGKRLLKNSTDDVSVEVTTRTLSSIISQSPFPETPVDLLDIDCEGADFSVLQSYDFSGAHPHVICIEAHTGEEYAQISEFLFSHGYQLLAERKPSYIFVKRKSANDSHA